MPQSPNREHAAECRAQRWINNGNCICGRDPAWPTCEDCNQPRKTVAACPHCNEPICRKCFRTKHDTPGHFGCEDLMERQGAEMLQDLIDSPLRAVNAEKGN